MPRRGIFIVRKTKAEILDMITVWAALESMAARLATKEATDEELASLHDLVDSFSTDEVAAQDGRILRRQHPLPSGDHRARRSAAASPR